ncbi:MAG: NFACT RNA binding domain-containing protein [Candidatus Eiseniibacteriota bacterium]
MSALSRSLAGSLVGQRVTGVIALSPRSLALGLGARPRRYLWVHLERKRAELAFADKLPTIPDPRGSRYGAIEEAVRELTVLRAETTDDGSFRVGLGQEGSSEATHELELSVGGARTNLIARSLTEGTILWALHRDEGETSGAGAKPKTSGAERADAKPGAAADRADAESPADPPARAFHRPEIRIAETAEEHAQLAAQIQQAFDDDFQRDLTHKLNAAERGLTRRLEAQGGDLERTRAFLASRRWGEILLAHFKDVPRGASRVRLPDTFADSPGATVEIPLDPTLTPQQNAARLFQRAKKGERGERLVEQRLAQTRKSLAGLAGMRRDLLSRPPKEALRLLDDFLREAALNFKARGDDRKIRLGRRTVAAPRAGRPGHRSPGARESIRPRTLVTSDGWEVWVGRNNTDNDLITHRLSNPHDLWFHVVGVPGSHVILRRPSRNAVPKPRALEEAAAIAAYYSKARKLSRVPVIFTERKFVSRPRRGKPGQALCTRERELLVRPGLPETNAGDDG